MFETLVSAAALLAPLMMMEPGEGGRRPDLGKRFGHIFKKIDKNGDGRIDKEERAEARKAFAKMRDRFLAHHRGDSPKKRDGRPPHGHAKRDGKPDHAGHGKGGGHHKHFREMMKKKFDKNKDGKLDEKEREEAKKAFAKHRKRFAREHRKGPKDGGCPQCAARRRHQEGHHGHHARDGHGDHRRDHRAKDGKGCPQCAAAHRRHHAGHGDRDKPSWHDARYAEKDRKGKGCPVCAARRRHHAKHKPGGHGPHHAHDHHGKGPGSFRARMVHHIVAADGNHDGKLNADEFAELARRHFDHLDADNDGYVTREEFRRMMGRLHHRPPHHRPGR